MREYPVRKKPIPMYLRKLKNLYGRACELKRRLEAGQLRRNAQDLADKVFGSMDFSMEELCELIEDTAKQMKDQEALQKNAKIQQWKEDMRSDIAKRGLWVTKKPVNRIPPLTREGSISKTKNEAIQMIIEGKKELESRVRWTAGEEEQAIQELTQSFSEKFGGVQSLQEPAEKLLGQTMRKAEGSPGLDQWTASEIKSLASSHPERCP